MYFAHETAVVDDSGSDLSGPYIGEGTKIWHFCHIYSTAVIGKDCVIGQGCMIGENARIGNSVHIQNNVSIYEGITLEDEVFVGPSVVFTNDLYPPSKREHWKQTLVKKGASIGANVTILPGITIGEGAMIGAGSVVTKNVDPYTTVAGNPARRLK